MPRTRKSQATALPDEELTEEGIVKLLRDMYGEEAAAANKIVPARDYISTQNATIDYVIGRPGIPCGRITNVYGQEASGKSTLGYHLLAETQRRGGFAVLYDAENSWDPDRGKRIGVDTNKLIWLEPPHMEQGLDEIKTIVTTLSAQHPDKLITIVWDSITAAVPKATLEGSATDSQPAIQARLVSQNLKALNEALRGTKTALVLVNQLRFKLEFGGIPGHGPKYTQVAEQSIKFYSSLRLSFVKVGSIGDKDEPDGIETLVKVEKNKIAPPYRNGRFNLMFWDGFDRVSAVLDVATKIGAVMKSGSWYEYEGRKFQSSKFAEILESSPELIDRVKAAPERWIHEQTQPEADVAEAA